MKAQGTFSVMNPGESEVFAFDFTYDLADGDSVRGDVVPVWQAVKSDGTAAGSILDGQPTVTGNKTFQRVSNPAAATVYALSATVQTVLGNTLELWGFLPCRAVGAPVG